MGQLARFGTSPCRHLGKMGDLVPGEGESVAERGGLAPFRGRIRTLVPTLGRISKFGTCEGRAGFSRPGVSPSLGNQIAEVGRNRGTKLRVLLRPEEKYANVPLSRLRVRCCGRGVEATAIDALVLKQPQLAVDAPGISRQASLGAHHAMAGTDDAYRIAPQCEEMPECHLEMRCKWLVLNGSAWAQEEGEGLRALLKYIESGIVTEGDELVKQTPSGSFSWLAIINAAHGSLAVWAISHHAMVRHRALVFPKSFRVL